MSFFNVRTPTKDELYNCQHIDITSPTVEWEPYSTQFEEAESRLNDYEDTRRELKSLDVLWDDFHDKIMRRTMAASKVSNTQLFVNSEELAKKWLVGLKVAQDTVRATTQHLTRNTIHPIERRYKTRAATLQYNQLKCRFYSDTFFSQEKSLLNHTCGQLFVTNFGFTKFVPILARAH
jgi:hypothetical protein